MIEKPRKTEESRKIMTWRHERVNKKGFKSQDEYDRHNSAMKHLRNLSDAEGWPIEMIEFWLTDKLGYGDSRAKEIAVQWISQRT